MNLFKKILNRTYRPLLQWYLARHRSYSYQNIRLVVNEGVFHPGFFFSTKFLLKELEGLALSGKTLLELGCGSGLIAIVASKSGANVTAADVNPVAVANTDDNLKVNKCTAQLVVSNLFENIPQQKFDYIIINPPYFRGKPKSMAEAAWYAGENLEYFQTLFQQLPNYIHASTLALMVLSENCELESIKQLALLKGLDFILRRSRKFWLEEEFIFTIARQKSA